MNFKPIETDENVLVMPGAVVCGDVTVGEGTAFWFNSVCRAELQPIKIGKRCNIQDCAVIHNLCTLGDDVSVGHGAIVHGATVGDRVIVGMGAIVLDGAKIGDDCIIAAGAVVTGKMDAPAGSLLVGFPPRSQSPERQAEGVLPGKQRALLPQERGVPRVPCSAGQISADGEEKTP